MAQKQVGQQKVRLPLMGAYSNRDETGNKDQRFINMFPETRKVDQLENTKIFINKRPGLTNYRAFGSGEGRGLLYFRNRFYVAIGNTVYEDTGVGTPVLTLGNSTGPLGMILANSSSFGDYIFICDGTSAWVIKQDGTVATIVGGRVGTISITTAGAGYATTPTVTISAPPAGTTATATATVVSGTLTAIDLVEAGAGYLVAPTVTISPPVHTFSPAATVNVSLGTIAILNTTYGTANPVVYSNGGGTSIGGLTNGATYYVIKYDVNNIRLATSVVNANAGTFIALSSVGTGTSHTLTGGSTATATATVSTSQLPSPHTPSPTFIDGYICLAKDNDVYTCTLDNPLDWNPSNFLSAEMFPDRVVALARQNNQVVVFGTNSIEFFYDAANASGSPLSRNDSTVLQMGTAAPYAIYQNEQTCIFVSASESGGRAAWIIKGFQPQKISDEYIERILDAESDMSDCRGFGIRTKGHLFYVLNLKTLNRTLVYDVDEKLWHEWSSNNAGSHSVFQYDHLADTGIGAAYVLHSSNGTVYKVDPTVYSDDSVQILCTLVTNKYDMDSYHRKFMSSLKLVGDSYSNNTVTFYWSDDDYQTWSNPKQINMNDDFPAFQRLGAFRRRAFKFEHAATQPLRLESVEVEFTEGAT